MSRRGFTLLELCIITGILAVLGAIVIPNLTVAYKHGSEPGAIGTLRTIAAAQQVFLGRRGRYGDLRELVAANLVDPAIAGGPKQGYRFAAAASTRAPALLWYATAEPVVPGTTGDRYFAARHDGMLFYTFGPGARPFAIPADTCAIPSSASPIGR